MATQIFVAQITGFASLQSLNFDGVPDFFIKWLTKQSLLNFAMLEKTVYVATYAYVLSEQNKIRLCIYSMRTTT